ncbi:MAG: hypothetical protein Q7U16_12565 [Agitococcus sp.]|nr:hypothetical protein [Agitococcus sp.]
MDLCYTPLSYNYRDADNYKATSLLFLDGRVTEAQKQALKQTMDQEEFFIPPQVGLTALQDTMTGFPTDSDHVWHTVSFDEPIQTLPEGETVLCSVEDFLERFTKVTFWDVAKEAERLGID